MGDRLYFYSGSKDCMPGSGIHEQVNNVTDYKYLIDTKDWRKMLSNFWESPFEVKEIRWNTVEHMYQAYKLSTGDKDIAYSMCLNSGSDLSKSGGLAARNMRKAITLNKKQLDEWQSLKDRVLEAALYAKFSQHEYLKRVLIATAPAELWHGAARIPPSRQSILEKVRDRLASE
jgi:hypothetical protein